jgi:hypothetical protein
MPDYFSNVDDSMQPYIFIDRFGHRYVNNLSIEFTPINNDGPTSAWNGVYRYEIVQAKRGIADSYKIMQGFSGYPQVAGEDATDDICLPYFLTTQRFDVLRGIATRFGDGTFFKGFGNATEWTYLHDNATHIYKQSKNQLLFVSPEYIYQPDDVESLLKQYKTSIYHHTIALYEHLDDCVQDTNINTFNAADEVYKNGHTQNSIYYLKSTYNNGDNAADLRVGVYPNDAPEAPSGTYYLT